MIVDNILRDTKIGLRVLARERSFCALAILVLALGISGFTALFAVVNGVMIRGFSFPNATRMMGVNFADPATGVGARARGSVSSMDFAEMLPIQKSFSLMAAYTSGDTVNMTVAGQPRRYQGAHTSETFFRALGLQPIMGRDFTADDNRPGAEQVAIIGYALWQRDFGGAQNIVGQAVRLNGQAATIIGVMPKGFAFPYREEVWVPLYTRFPVRPRNDSRDVAASVLGMLKPGVSLDRANAEVSGIAKQFAAASPATNKLRTAGIVRPLKEWFTPDGLRGTLLTMLGFCVGVLLIACVNVMNMQFARATLRARELAVRSALGATRGRLIRQMLTESFIVACAGAAIGVGLAYLAVDWLWATVHTMENGPPTWMTFTIDGRVLAWTVAATLAAAVLSALLPAWMASRGSAVAVLRDGTRGSTGRGVAIVTRGLVVLQIVVTCVLLVGSLLEVRSIIRQQNIDFGYDTSGQLSARLGLMEADYPTATSRKLFYDRLLATLRGAPEFQTVALTSRMRMVLSDTTRVEIDGKAYTDDRDRPNANFEQVSSGFHEAIGQKVLQGRTFDDGDSDARLPVAVVNAAFARKHFGTGSAVGRRFRTMDGPEQAGPWRIIVGVVANVRMLGPYNNPAVDNSGFYAPFSSNLFGPATLESVPSQFATVVVTPRQGLRAETLGAALRREVDKVDRDLPLYYVGTPRQHIDNALAQNRVIVGMFLVFGVVAIVLASVGIYGIVSFSVNQRRQEFGVRMALGADTGRIVTMVLKQGAWQLAIGLAAGFGLTLLLASLGRDVLATMLFDVSPHDPFAYVAVFAVVTLVSLVAILVPGRRASRVDPLIALRAE